MLIFVCVYVYWQELKLKVGILTTANSLDHTEMDDSLMLEYGKISNVYASSLFVN